MSRPSQLQVDRTRSLATVVPDRWSSRACPHAGSPVQNPAYRRAHAYLHGVFELGANAVLIKGTKSSADTSHMHMENEMTAFMNPDDDRPWAARSECRGEDPAIFFPGTDDDPSRGLAICARCPVRQECLDYAIEARERYGIWGGTTERQRRRMVRRSA